LTARALRDGFIRPDDVEHVAQKGYHMWGAPLLSSRRRAVLAWDVAYAMAVHGMPREFIFRLIDTGVLERHALLFARIMRRVRALARRKARIVDRIARRPNLLQHYFANLNRREAPADVTLHPNFDNSPFSTPLGPALRPPQSSISPP
jgi:hypothetical protein